MDLPIRPVEVDRAAPAARRARDERETVFEVDAEARRRHGGADEEQPEARRERDDQPIAPRPDDEAGSHLDVTA